jgi:hypothetical protein
MQAPYSRQGSPETLHRIAMTKGFSVVRVCNFPHQVFRAMVAPRCPGAPDRATVAFNGHDAADAFEHDAGGAQRELIFPILVGTLDFGGDRFCSYIKAPLGFREYC